MAEARATARNGLNVVSLFSGCGGSDLGFELAGYQTIVATDFEAAARETYRANFPTVPIIDRDVRDLRIEDLLEHAGKARIDVLVGSPPCASFSMGARHEGGLEGGWGKVKEYGRGKKQRTDDLFHEFMRILEGLRPRAFVAENVFGLVRGKAKGHFLEFLERMNAAGYRTRAQLVDAQWMGVPQVRSRVIFVGVREDIVGDPEPLKPLPYRHTVADALDHPSCPGEVEEDAKIEGYAIEPEARKLAPGEKSAKFFNLRRLRMDHPARTILASSGHPGAAGPLHPNGLRKLTIAELKRICGFPADFVLTGSYEERWERLGRAVPPPMMRAVADNLAPILLAASGGR